MSHAAILSDRDFDLQDVLKVVRSLGFIKLAQIPWAAGERLDSLETSRTTAVDLVMYI